MTKSKDKKRSKDNITPEEKASQQRDMAVKEARAYSNRREALRLAIEMGPRDDDAIVKSANAFFNFLQGLVVLNPIPSDEPDSSEPAPFV